MASRLAGQEKVSFFFNNKPDKEERESERMQFAMEMCLPTTLTTLYFFLSHFSFSYFATYFLLLLLFFFFLRKETKSFAPPPCDVRPRLLKTLLSKKENAGIKTLKFISSLILAFVSFPSECIFYFLFIS